MQEGIRAKTGQISIKQDLTLSPWVPRGPLLGIVFMVRGMISSQIVCYDGRTLSPQIKFWLNSKRVDLVFFLIELQNQADKLVVTGYWMVYIFIQWVDIILQSIGSLR